MLISNSIIETEHSIFEYDDECVKCNNIENIFVLLSCIIYFRHIFLKLII